MSLPTGTSTLVLLERGIVSREDSLITGSVGSAKSHNVKTYFEYVLRTQIFEIADKTEITNTCRACISIQSTLL